MYKLFRHSIFQTPSILRLNNQHLRTLYLDSTTIYTKAEIKRKYAELVKKYHPDICKEPKATERFNLIVHAYEAIIDELDNGPIKRTQGPSQTKDPSYRETQTRKREQYYKQYPDLDPNEYAKFYKVNEEMRYNRQQIPEWRLIEHLDKLLIVFVIAGIVLRYYFTKDINRDPVNIAQRNKLRLHRERQTRTRMLKEFSSAEMERYTLKDLIAMEKAYIGKIPDDVFEDILDNTNVEEFYHSV